MDYRHADNPTPFHRLLAARTPPARSGIYCASKVKHAPLWQALRAAGVPISASWIDEAGEGQTADYAELSARCLDEIRQARALLLYCEPNEILKGALVEVGAALAHGVPVLCVGRAANLSRVFEKSELWLACDTLQEALDQMGLDVQVSVDGRYLPPRDFSCHPWVRGLKAPEAWNPYARGTWFHDAFADGQDEWRFHGGHIGPGPHTPPAGWQLPAADAKRWCHDELLMVLYAAADDPAYADMTPDDVDCVLRHFQPQFTGFEPEWEDAELRVYLEMGAPESLTRLNDVKLDKLLRRFLDPLRAPLQHQLAAKPLAPRPWGKWR